MSTHLYSDPWRYETTTNTTIDWTSALTSPRPARERPNARSKTMGTKPLAQFTKPDGKSVWVDADYAQTVQGATEETHGEVGTAISLGDEIVVVQGDPADVAEKLRAAVADAAKVMR